MSSPYLLFVCFLLYLLTLALWYLEPKVFTLVSAFRELHPMHKNLLAPCIKPRITLLAFKFPCNPTPRPPNFPSLFSFLSLGLYQDSPPNCTSFLLCLCLISYSIQHKLTSSWPVLSTTISQYIESFLVHDQLSASIWGCPSRSTSKLIIFKNLPCFIKFLYCSCLSSFSSADYKPLEDEIYAFHHLLLSECLDNVRK